MDGSYQINKGLHEARDLLIEINRIGLPVGAVYDDTISPQFIADLVSWSCISINSSNSTLLHELASGLSTPVGFHNVNGPHNVVIDGAINAVLASAEPHSFMSVSKEGLVGNVETSGNRDCHVILNGSSWRDENVESVIDQTINSLSVVDGHKAVMLDCGSWSAGKGYDGHYRQINVGHKAAEIITRGGKEIVGVMLRSNLDQRSDDPEYLDWQETEDILGHLFRAQLESQAISACSPTSHAATSSSEIESLSAENPRLLGLDNLRVRAIRQLLPPACLLDELPADNDVARLVFSTRCAISGLIHQLDADYVHPTKLLVVVGPNVLHNSAAGIEFAARLAAVAKELEDDLIILMRVNFDIANHWSASTSPEGRRSQKSMNNEGLRKARQLLIDINRLGLPVATDYLDTISPQFFADLISWAAVPGSSGLATSHQELASGLSTPVGFYEPTISDDVIINDSGNACTSAVLNSARPHAFLSVSKQGIAGIVETSGNRDCHVVLPRGALKLSSYIDEVVTTCDNLRNFRLPPRIMVDCGITSPSQQMNLVRDLATSINDGNDCVFGLLIHSFLISGAQKISNDRQPIYGMSTGQPCIDWTATEELLRQLAQASRRRNHSREGAVQVVKKSRDR